MSSVLASAGLSVSLHEPPGVEVGVGVTLGVGVGVDYLVRHKHPPHQSRFCKIQCYRLANFVENQSSRQQSLVANSGLSVPVLVTIPDAGCSRQGRPRDAIGSRRNSYVGNSEFFPCSAIYGVQRSTRISQKIVTRIIQRYLEGLSVSDNRSYVNAQLLYRHGRQVYVHYMDKRRVLLNVISIGQCRVKCVTARTARCRGRRRRCTWSWCRGRPRCCCRCRRRCGWWSSRSWGWRRCSSRNRCRGRRWSRRPCRQLKSINFVAGGKIDSTARDDAGVPLACISHQLVCPTAGVHHRASIAIVAVQALVAAFGADHPHNRIIGPIRRRNPRRPLAALAKAPSRNYGWRICRSNFISRDRAAPVTKNKVFPVGGAITGSRLTSDCYTPRSRRLPVR